MTNRYEVLQSELRLCFLRAGFQMPEDSRVDDFQEELDKRLRSVFGGVIQEALTVRARQLCSWPITFTLDALPLMLLGYTMCLILRAYWRGDLLPPVAFLHTGVVFLLLVAAELFIFSSGVRLLAWTVIRRCLLVLRKALADSALAFKYEKQILEENNTLIQTIKQLHDAISFR